MTKSRLQQLRDKYPEPTALDPKPWADTRPGRAGRRYAYTAIYSVNRFLVNEGLVVWNPGSDYAQREEDYANPFTRAS